MQHQKEDPTTKEIETKEEDSEACRLNPILPRPFLGIVT